MELYDLIIIGGGPAGMSSAVYAGRSTLKTLIIEKSSYGGRIKDTLEIVNYPAIKKTSGEELSNLLREHVKSYDTVSFLKSTVNSIEKNGDIFKIATQRKGDFYSKAVILATGTSPKVLGIEGEAEFTGNGVAYCATCDAEFFKNQDVFVLGAGDQAIEEAMFIAKFAKSVTIIVIHDEGKLDCNEIAKNQVFKNEKIKFIWNSTVHKIIGDETLTSLDIINVKTKEITNYKASGLFSFVGMIPRTELVKDIVKTDKLGYIHVNEKKETSLLGLYAVGDCTANYLKQVVTACADGAIAATAVGRFISEQEIIQNELKAEGKVIFIFYTPYDEKSLKNMSFVESELKTKIIKIDISKQEYLYKKLELSKNFAIVVYENEKIIFNFEKEELKDNDLLELKEIL